MSGVSLAVESGVPLAVESGVPLAVETKDSQPRTLVSRQGVSLAGTVVTMLNVSWST